MDFATKNVKCKVCEVTQGMWEMTTQQRGSTHMQTKSEYQIILETFFFNKLFLFTPLTFKHASTLKFLIYLLCFEFFPFNPLY